MKKIALTACLGNLFEHYDTALFGLLAPFLAPLIFPSHDPLTALILTYAIIPLGMIARPLGALVFGFIGDQYGRACALFLTLFGMALISGGIACIPTYLQIGLFAPLLFCIARVLQNFLAGGEIMGGAIFLLENAEEKRHDWLSGLYSASTMGGHLLASFGISLLCRFDLIEPGWRLLYLFGCTTALFGALLRAKPSQQFSNTKCTAALKDLFPLLWDYRRTIFLIAICSGFSYANYSIALVVINGFVPLISPLTKVEMMQLNSYLLIFDFCALPFFGWLASKMQREKMMVIAALGACVSAIPLSMLLAGATTLTVVLVRICFIIFGVAFFAPFHAWVQGLVAPHHRYTVIAFGYALGTQLIGGATSALSLWCFKKTAMVSSIVWYWALLALVSTLCIAMTKKMGQKGALKRAPFI